MKSSSNQDESEDDYFQCGSEYPCPVHVPGTDWEDHGHCVFQDEEYEDEDDEEWEEDEDEIAETLRLDAIFDASPRGIALNANVALAVASVVSMQRWQRQFMQQKQMLLDWREGQYCNITAPATDSCSRCTVSFRPPQVVKAVQSVMAMQRWQRECMQRKQMQTDWPESLLTELPEGKYYGNVVPTAVQSVMAMQRWQRSRGQMGGD